MLQPVNDNESYSKTMTSEVIDKLQLQGKGK